MTAPAGPAELEKARRWIAASRVQGLAGGSEICLAEDAYDSPGVGGLLRGLRVSPEQAALKGVCETMKIYRVAGEEH